MFSEKAREAIREELANGLRARTEGFEGRARVCARRAAGAAAREYFRQRQVQPGGSAHDLLRILAEFEGVGLRVRESAARFLTRVDEDFNLAKGVDLLEEARTLAEELEGLLE